MGGYAWLDYDGLTLGGAMSWGSNAIRLNQGANGAAIGWYNSAAIRATAPRSHRRQHRRHDPWWRVCDGGSFRRSEQHGLWWWLMLVDDSVGIMANAISRTLTDDSVTSWGASAAYSDAGIGLGGYRWYGARFGDASAIAMGSGLGVDMPDGGDMALGLNLLNVNLAGEFMFNDWFGLRGR